MKETTERKLNIRVRTTPNLDQDHLLRLRIVIYFLGSTWEMEPTCIT